MGYSVLEMTNAFENVSGQAVPYEIVGRRPGDAASCYSDTSLAREVLGWEAGLGLIRMDSDLDGEETSILSIQIWSCKIASLKWLGHVPLLDFDLGQKSPVAWGFFERPGHEGMTYTTNASRN